MGWLLRGLEWLSRGMGAHGEAWKPRLVARTLATASLWVRIQTSFKNRKWMTKAKEVASTL